MSKEQVISEAMELPLPERISLAQALWQSIDEGLADAEKAMRCVRRLRAIRSFLPGSWTVAPTRRSCGPRGAPSDAPDLSP
jgi:hypothetical protein